MRLWIFRLRSEVVASLTGVFQSAFLISRCHSELATSGAQARAMLRRRPFANDAGQRCYDGEEQNTREGGGDLLIEAGWQNARALL